jgi:hypothetical protein
MTFAKRFRKIRICKEEINLKDESYLMIDISKRNFITRNVELQANDFYGMVYRKA